MILTSPTSKSLSKQPTFSAPHAPKKSTSAKSCAAAVPYIRSLRFDVGGGDEPLWLRLNHRVNPMQKMKVSPDKLHKRNVEHLHFQELQNSHTLHKSKKQKSAAVTADEKDTSASISTSEND